MKKACEDFVKYCLLLLLLLPFLALAAEALGKAAGRMLNAAAFVMPVSWILVWAVGGFERRPNVAILYCLAWLAWPALLLMAKGFNPRLLWVTLWLSVPLMSWYLVTMVVLFEGRGGLGAGMGLFLGWAYMILPFAVLNIAFLALRGCLEIVVELWAERNERQALKLKAQSEHR